MGISSRGATTWRRYPGAAIAISQEIRDASPTSPLLKSFARIDAGGSRSGGAALAPCACACRASSCRRARVASASAAHAPLGADVVAEMIVQYDAARDGGGAGQPRLDHVHGHERGHERVPAQLRLRPQALRRGRSPPAVHGGADPARGPPRRRRGALARRSTSCSTSCRTTRPTCASCTRRRSSSSRATTSSSSSRTCSRVDDIFSEAGVVHGVARGGAPAVELGGRPRGDGARGAAGARGLRRCRPSTPRARARRRAHPRLGYITGVIERSQLVKFERILFRATRGTCTRGGRDRAAGARPSHRRAGPQECLHRLLLRP